MNDGWVGLAVALGVGLLVGVERERRKGRGPQRRAAGLRTFALVTVAGALTQSLGPGALVVAGALAVATFAALAYWRSAQGAVSQDDPGLTTEVALVVAYLVGVQCAVNPPLGAACGAVLAGLLAAREHMHRFATEWLTEQELRDALVLAGVALVLVPLAPAAPLPGLGGLAPRTAAGLVLLILGIQAAAHVARRLLGERHALAAAGLFGGFVSSTATVATLGAQAKPLPAPAQRSLAGAAGLSGAATWLQSLALGTAISPALLPQLLPMALAGVAAAAASGFWLLRAHRAGALVTPASGSVPQHPLRLREALLVAALLLGVSMAVGWLRTRFGTQGLLAGTALAALADAHAPIASAFGLLAEGVLEPREALLAVLVATAVNSASRSAVAWVAGGPGYGARVSGVLALSWAAAALGLLAGSG